MSGPTQPTDHLPPVSVSDRVADEPTDAPAQPNHGVKADVFEAHDRLIQSTLRSLRPRYERVAEGIARMSGGEPAHSEISAQAAADCPDLVTLLQGAFDHGGLRVQSATVRVRHEATRRDAFGDEQIVYTLRLLPGERLFGGGLRTGGLDHRGRRLTCWATDPVPPHDAATDAMYQSIPFVLGLAPDGRARGVYVATDRRVTLDLGATDPDTLVITVDGVAGPLALADAVENDADPSPALYLFAGPTLADALRQYTEVTGRAPMPPRWALGYHQARWSYATAGEARAVAARLRAERIPCDGLWLDIDYMDGYRDFTWDATRFADPPGLLAALHADGYHVVAILDPGVKVDPHDATYQDGLARDVYVRTADGAVFEGWCWPGRAVWPDFVREQTRAWWAERVGALVAQAGLDGVWVDMNEPSQTGMFAPEGVDVPYGATLPLDARHWPAARPLPHAAVHNAYATQMARATREGLAQARPQTRPFVLTRAAGAGAQRYAAIWTGDTSSRWAHLRLAVTSNLGVGLSGLPFTGSDIGGFWEDCTPELLTRFTQLGAFLPFCRNHSALDTARQEPWAFGEPYTSLCRAAIERRYRLLPYLYTRFHEAATSGAPVMRPLAWLAPDDPASVACDDQFLLGDDLLIAPVLEKGATERRVTLPPGRWCEVETGAWHTGGRTLTLPVTLASVPQFARDGAILPLAGVTQHSGEPASEPLVLHVYLGGPGTPARATLWDDDEHPQAEQRGTFAEYTLTGAWTKEERTGERIVVTMKQTGGALPFRYPGARVALHLPDGYSATPIATTETSETMPFRWEWRVSRA